MPGRPRAVVIGYYVAFTLLVVGLAIGFALVTRIAGPTRGIDVSAPVAVTCEPGEGSPSCYDFTVSNTSAEPRSAACLVVPAPGTIARFTTDASTVSLTLQPGEARTLRASVDTVAGGSVAPPEVGCDPVSG
jgi:hypothetical protein